MRHTILAMFVILSMGLTTQAQTDCYNTGKAKIAKENMDEGDDGLTCANAAKFYVMLCQYHTEPLTVEQGSILKMELKALKKAYNDYGVYCKDIGRIDDVIRNNPTITVVDEEEATTEDILFEAVSNTIGGNSGTSKGDCNYAAQNKFGNRSFSSPRAESAANQYEGYRCHCINGTAQRQFDGSKFSVKQLKNLRQNYYNVKKPGDPGLSPLPAKCADSPNGGSPSGHVTGGGHRQNLGDILVGEQLSNNLTEFANGLANISDNPKIKRLAEDMNAVQQKYDQVEAGVQNIASRLGGSIDQETRNMMNFYQNAEMAVAIGKAIFGKEPSLEERLSESQLAVREAMLETSRSLRTIYNEVNSVEPYLGQGEKYLTILENRKQKIIGYNALTVKDRYLYLWYLEFNGYPDVEDYNAELSRIEQLKVNQLLEEIAKLQSDRDMTNKPHIANMDLAFARANNQIVLNKMSYYKKNGQKDKAEALQQELTFNVPIGQTISLIIDSFNQKEYFATAQYAQIVQDHFQNEEVMQLYYENIPGLQKGIGLFGDSDAEIGRGEVSILMLLGIIAAVETEQYTQAQNGLEVLKGFHNNTLEWSQSKSKGGRRKRAKQDAVKNVLETQLTKSHLSLNVAKAYINLGLRNYETAIENTTTAKEYLTITSGMVSGIPEGLLHRLKIEAYMGLQDYGKAKEVFRAWNSTQSNVNEIYFTGDGAINYLGETDKDFYNALIRYHKKDNKGALIALKLMKKKIDDPEIRIYILEEKIHQGLGNTEEAKKAHSNYINLLTK